MNKFFLTVFSLLLVLLISGQSVDKGRLQFKLGAGPYFGKITSSHTFDNGTLSLNTSSSDVVELNSCFSIHYNTHRNFSLGVFTSADNNGQTDSLTNFGTTSLGFSAQYYIINKPKFNLFFDARVGGLNYSENSSGNATNKISIEGKGSMNSFSLGVNKYFGNVFGLYLQSGFMRQGFQLNSYKIDGGDQIKFVEANKLEDIKTMFNGAFVNVGITIKIRNKSPKSE